MREQLAAQIAGSVEPSAAGTDALLGASRGRVFTRLQRAAMFAVVVVAAPPGYGKSTVVREFLHTDGRAYRWIELDRDDDSILGVLHAFAAALGAWAPAFASAFPSVYDRLADAPDAAGQLAAWAAEFVAPLKVTLVVDGLDQTTGAAVSAFLAELIDRCDSASWVVITETTARLPVARWLADGRMDVPIDQTDLELTEHDVRRARGRTFVALSDRQVAQLCRRCDGWPAAIALGLAGAHSIDLAGAPQGRTELYAYLAESLVATLPVVGRRFVERTTLFARFDRALLDAAGLYHAQATIDVLCERFGVLAVDASGTYRYNRPFAAFLHARLRARGAVAFERLATATARAYEADGRFACAIATYLEIDDHAAVARVLGARGFALMESGELTTVGRALAAIPHETLATVPVALAVKASVESLHGKWDIAEAWFRLALDGIGEKPERDEIMYRLAADLVRRERSDAVDLLDPFVRAISSHSPLAAPLYALLATAYASKRDMAAATAAMEEALALLPRVVDRTIRAKVLHQAGFVAFNLGHIARAKDFSTQAHQAACAVYNYDIAARALSVLYNIAVDHEDDIAAGRAYLERLAHYSVLAGSRHLLLYALLCRYEIEVRSGDVREIARLDERLKPLEHLFSVLTTETLLPALAIQATWKGDFCRAYRLLEPSAEQQIDPERQACRHAEIALYAAAAGFRDRAVRSLRRALRLVRQIDSADKIGLEAYAYIALTFVLLHRRAAAATLIARQTPRTAHHERIGALLDVVAQLAERWRGAAQPGQLAAALERLEALELGGLARMLEALPLPPAAPSPRDSVAPGGAAGESVG